MNIMIVEDSLATRKMVGSLVNTGGGTRHSLIEAESSEQALELLAKPDATPVDCFLLDVNLPGMSGTELCAQIRARQSSVSRNLPYIIMVTANEGEDIISEAMKVGANDYITKPVNLPVLQIRLRVAKYLVEIAKFSEESDYFRALVYGSFNLASFPVAICQPGDDLQSLPICYVNQSFAALLGVAQRQLLGQSLPTLQAWTAGFQADIQGAFTTGQNFQGPLASNSMDWMRLGLGVSASSVISKAGEAPSYYLFTYQTAVTTR